MPLTGPSSFITVVPAFVNHWLDAESQLSTTIELDKETLGEAADVGIGFLSDLNSALTDARDTLEATLLDLALAQGLVLGHKTWLHATCVAFNKAVRADHGSTHFPGALPEAPQMSDGREKFNRPIRRMNSIWPKVNTYRAALTPPKTALTTSNGAVVATAVTRLGQLVTQWDVVEERDGQAVLDRLLREAIQDRIRPVLVLYRKKIDSLVPPGHALLLSLPAVSDDGSGTPDPGSLTGTLNVDGTEVTLTGTASPSGTVVMHQLRASVGESPDADDENLRAEFELGQPITLTTNYGLGGPGSKVHWRLVAVTADAHEKATPWLTFQRPL